MITVEIRKEQRISESDAWYEIIADGKFITGSYDLDKVKMIFNKIKENKQPIVTKEILISEEINISLEELKNFK